MRRLILIVGMFFLLSNLLVAGRYYDAAVGRFLQIDPHASKYPSLSPYNYVANNPLNAVDPDGKDIMFIYNKEGASGRGHSAVLIGNDQDGWNLYSKNGEKYLLAGPDKFQDGVQFENLIDFTNSGDNAKYESGVLFTTGSDTDNKAKSTASEVVKTEYDIEESNCADMTSDVGQKNGINVPKNKTTDFETGLNYTDPNKQYHRVKNLDNAVPVDLTKLKKDEENEQ